MKIAARRRNALQFVGVDTGHIAERSERLRLHVRVLPRTVGHAVARPRSRGRAGEMRRIRIDLGSDEKITTAITSDRA